MLFVVICYYLLFVIGIFDQQHLFEVTGVLNLILVYIALLANCEFPAVLNIQLGELLCESLMNAEDAPVLEFAVGPNEVRQPTMLPVHYLVLLSSLKL